MTEKILVSGATGTVGSRVLRELRERGADVRAVSRNAHRVAAWRAEGVDAAQADLSDLGDALADCDQLFVVSPGAPEQFAHERAAIDAARSHGIRRIVKVSAADANPGSPASWASAHGLSDDFLVSAGVDYVILRASSYMTNLQWFATPAKRGFLPHSARSGATGWIDPDDIARCAAAALLSDESSTIRYITGPEMLSFDDIALRLSRHLGRRVRAVHLPGAVYQRLLRLSGTDAFMARGLRAQYADVMRLGQEDPGLTGDVALLTGRRPTTLAAFLDANPL